MQYDPRPLRVYCVNRSSIGKVSVDTVGEILETRDELEERVSAYLLGKIHHALRQSYLT